MKVGNYEITVRKTSSDEFGDNVFIELNGSPLKLKGGTKKQQVFAKSLIDEMIERSIKRIEDYEIGNIKRAENGKLLKDIEPIKKELSDKIDRLLSKSATEILNNQHWI